MTLGEEIRGHLPYLRRYARALTGSQQHGDNFVHTTLEVIVAAPHEFHSGDGTRIDLYRNFHRIWERDRKSTRLNPVIMRNSYAVFCLKQKTHIHIYTISKA